MSDDLVEQLRTSLRADDKLHVLNAISDELEDYDLLEWHRAGLFDALLTCIVAPAVNGAELAAKAALAEGTSSGREIAVDTNGDDGGFAGIALGIPTIVLEGPAAESTDLNAAKAHFGHGGAGTTDLLSVGLIKGVAQLLADASTRGMLPSGARPTIVFELMLQLVEAAVNDDVATANAAAASHAANSSVHGPRLREAGDLYRDHFAAHPWLMLLIAEMLDAAPKHYHGMFQEALDFILNYISSCVSMQAPVGMSRMPPTMQQSPTATLLGLSMLLSRDNQGMRRESQGSISATSTASAFGLRPFSFVPMLNLPSNQNPEARMKRPSIDPNRQFVDELAMAPRAASGTPRQQIKMPPALKTTVTCGHKVGQLYATVDAKTLLGMKKEYEALNSAAAADGGLNDSQCEGMEIIVTPAVEGGEQPFSFGDPSAATSLFGVALTAFEADETVSNPARRALRVAVAIASELLCHPSPSAHLLLSAELFSCVGRRDTELLALFIMALRRSSFHEEAALFRLFGQPVTLVGYPVEVEFSRGMMLRDDFLDHWAAIAAHLVERAPLPLDDVTWHLALLAHYLAPRSGTKHSTVLQAASSCLPIVCEIVDLLRRDVSYNLPFACALHYVVEIIDVFMCCPRPPQVLQRVLAMLVLKTKQNPLELCIREYARRLLLAPNPHALFSLRRPQEGKALSVEEIRDTVFWPNCFDMTMHMVRLIRHFRHVSVYTRRTHLMQLVEMDAHPISFMINPFDGCALHILSTKGTNITFPLHHEALRLIESICEVPGASPLLANQSWASTYIRFLYLSFLQLYNSELFVDEDPIILRITALTLRALAAVVAKDENARIKAHQLGIVSTLVQEVDLEQSVGEMRERYIRRSTAATTMSEHRTSDAALSMQITDGVGCGGGRRMFSVVSDATSVTPREGVSHGATRPTSPQPSATDIIAADTEVEARGAEHSAGNENALDSDAAAAPRPPPAKIVIPKLSLALAPPPLYYTSNGDTGGAVDATGSVLGGGGGASASAGLLSPIQSRPPASSPCLPGPPLQAPLGGAERTANPAAPQVEDARDVSGPMGVPLPRSNGSRSASNEASHHLPHHANNSGSGSGSCNGGERHSKPLPQLQGDAMMKQSLSLVTTPVDSSVDGAEESLTGLRTLAELAPTHPCETVKATAAVAVTPAVIGDTLTTPTTPQASPTTPLASALKSPVQRERTPRSPKFVVVSEGSPLEPPLIEPLRLEPAVCHHHHHQQQQQQQAFPQRDSLLVPVPGGTSVRSVAAVPGLTATASDGGAGWGARRNDSISSQLMSATTQKSLDGSFAVDRGLYPPQLLNDAMRFLAHQRSMRRIYRDADVQVEVLHLILQLAVRPEGMLDERILDSYTVCSKKINILFYLHMHVNHPSNQRVVELLVRRCLAGRNGRGVAVLLRLLIASPSLGELYVTSDRLGNGAYGVVRAAHLTLSAEPSENPFAAKFIPVPRHIDDRAAIVTLHTEVMALAALQDHPGVCRLVDFGNDGSQYAVVMHRYRMSVAAWRQQFGLGLNPALLPSCCGLFARILDLVHGTHRRGVVHYDLKCDNFFLDVDDRGEVLVPHIGDFGEAELLIREDEEAVGSQSTYRSSSRFVYERRARGTEVIRSPECLVPHKFKDRRRKMHQAGFQSDVWSLGCLFFELLAGRHLFHEDHYMKLIHRVTSEDGEILELDHKAMLGADTAVRSELVGFLLYVLCRDPQRRPLLTEVQVAFKALVAKLGISLELPTPESIIKAEESDVGGAHSALCTSQTLPADTTASGRSKPVSPLKQGDAAADVGDGGAVTAFSTARPRYLLSRTDLRHALADWGERVSTPSVTALRHTATTTTAVAAVPDPLVCNVTRNITLLCSGAPTLHHLYALGVTHVATFGDIPCVAGHVHYLSAGSWLAQWCAMEGDSASSRGHEADDGPGNSPYETGSLQYQQQEQRSNQLMAIPAAALGRYLIDFITPFIADAVYVNGHVLLPSFAVNDVDLSVVALLVMQVKLYGVKLISAFAALSRIVAHGAPLGVRLSACLEIAAHALEALTGEALLLPLSIGITPRVDGAAVALLNRRRSSSSSEKVAAGERKAPCATGHFPHIQLGVSSSVKRDQHRPSIECKPSDANSGEILSRCLCGACVYSSGFTSNDPRRVLIEFNRKNCQVSPPYVVRAASVKKLIADITLMLGAAVVEAVFPNDTVELVTLNELPPGWAPRDAPSARSVSSVAPLASPLLASATSTFSPRGTDTLNEDENGDDECSGSSRAASVASNYVFVSGTGWHCRSCGFITHFESVVSATTFHANNALPFMPASRWAHESCCGASAAAAAAAATTSAPSGASHTSALHAGNSILPVVPDHSAVADAGINMHLTAPIREMRRFSDMRVAGWAKEVQFEPPPPLMSDVLQMTL